MINYCQVGLVFLAVYVSFASCAPMEKTLDPDDEIIEPEEEFLRITTPAPLGFQETWDEWRTWEAPEIIVKMAPYYKSGYDRDGLPIIVTQYGKWNYRELAKLKPDQVEDFFKYYEQFLRRAHSEGAANNNAGIVFICDWDGFSLGNFASPHAMKLALRAFTSVKRFNDAIRHAFQINLNFAAETFVNISRPFFGNILEKFEVYGTRSEKWKPALLREIPYSQLPPEYGGDKDWKPAPWTV